MNVLKKKILNKDKEWTSIQNNYKKTIKQLEGTIKGYVLQIEELKALKAHTPKFKIDEWLWRVFNDGTGIETFLVNSIIKEKGLPIRYKNINGKKSSEIFLFHTLDEAVFALKKIVKAENNVSSNKEER